MNCCFARYAATRRRNDRNTPASPFLVPAFRWLDSRLPCGHLISSWGPSRPPVNGPYNQCCYTIYISIHWLIYSFIYINLSLPLVITHSFTHSLPSLQSRHISEHARWNPRRHLGLGNRESLGWIHKSDSAQFLSVRTNQKWRLRQRWGWIYPVPIKNACFASYSLPASLARHPHIRWSGLNFKIVTCDHR